MACVHPGSNALDYRPCRYGSSRIVFRGPRGDLSKPYIVFIGGTDTYGKFLKQPFADMVGIALDRQTVNLGCVNAGMDVYLTDPQVLAIIAQADLAVIQVLGAHNLSNRYYSVHPRRNDRFVAVTSEMRARFPEIDFSDFAFTRHMLGALHSRSPDRFGAVVEELQTVWVRRMRALLAQITGPCLLLWLSDRSPDDDLADSLDDDPLFVTRAMLDAIASDFDDIVVVSPDGAGCIGCTRCMVYSALEAPAAAQTAGIAIHREVAAKLAPRIAHHLA